MTNERGRGSVVLIPPTGEEQAALERARALLEVDDREVDSLRRRLDRSGMPPRRQLVPWGRMLVAGAAAAATVALAVLGVRVLGSGEAPGTDAGPRMVVETGADQTHSFSPVEGMTVQLAESSLLDVDPARGERVVLTLSRGAVDVDYRRPAGGPGLQVLAGDVVVTVTGTRFTVDRDENGVSVSVIRGSVVVSWPGGEAEVERGASWRSWNERPHPDAMAGAGEGGARERIAAGTEASTAGAAAGSAEPPARAAREGDGAGRGMGSAGPGVSAPDDADTAAPAAGGDEPDLGDDAALLNQILLQAASGVPAAERLFAMEQYLARYPGSDNADLVAAERVEALADIGADQEVLAAAEAFVERYPDSSRRGQVRWIEATVARDRLRDCSRALRAYRELAEAGSGSFQVQAMFYRGVCAAEEDYADEAVRALERAIELGLDPAREAEARALLDTLR